MNINILLIPLRTRTAERLRLVITGPPWRNLLGESIALGTQLSRLRKFRARQGLILVSSLRYQPLSDMSTRRPYSTNETNGSKQPLANGTGHPPPTRRPPGAHPSRDAADHDTLGYDHETPHSHSHSIFGHSHSNGVEDHPHGHGTEQIIAALEGKGLGP